VETPEPLLSRVFSVVGLITKGGLPFGGLLYGAVLDRLTLHMAAFFFTALTVLVSLLFLAGLRSYSHED
jgi:DHA3 family macrolide efflux protein-like MFS transporter